MSYPRGVRSFLQSPHHFCARCGTEHLLSNLEWQEGHLRCSRCRDTLIVGEREMMIARAFEMPSKELEVDEKLKDATAGMVADSINFIL